MSAVVVDASVVVKWFVPEVHAAAARRVLTQPDQFFAPDLLFAELANVLWKKTRRGEVTPEAAREILDALTRVDVDTVPCRTLAGEALLLAQSTGCTAYDAMYVALALRLECPIVTADERLAATLRSHPQLSDHVVLVQQL